MAVSGLRRARRGEPRLSGVDLSVPVGARLLLVSEPEGAASVLLRVLAGLSRPSSGDLRLAGVRRAEVGTDGAAGWVRRVAYVGPETALYPWLTAREALDLAGRLAGMPSDERQRRAAALLGRLRLGAAADQPMRRGGPLVAQKAALAAGLLTDPEVLLLDEPLRSLEPAERSRLLRMPGRRTVLLASRYPASEEGLVNQVALLRNGRVVLHAAVADLQAHGLPLSHRGIAALADLGPRAVPGRPATA